MLAGLSKNEIFSVPPAFWEKAEPLQHAAINSPPMIANMRNRSTIAFSLRCSSLLPRAKVTTFRASRKINGSALDHPIRVSLRCRRPIANRRERGFETPAFAGAPGGGLPVQPNVVETKIVDDAVAHHRLILDL